MMMRIPRISVSSTFMSFYFDISLLQSYTANSSLQKLLYFLDLKLTHVCLFVFPRVSPMFHGENYTTSSKKIQPMYPRRNLKSCDLFVTFHLLRNSNNVN